MAASSTTEQKPLEPPDKKQCQAEKPNPNNFMTMGGACYPKLIRCKAKPKVIVTEVKPGADGRKGSMSLCSECLEVFKKQEGTPMVKVKRIRG